MKPIRHWLSYSWRAASMLATALMLANLAAKFRLVVWRSALIADWLAYYHQVRQHVIDFLYSLLTYQLSATAFDIIVLYMLFGNGLAAWRFYQAIRLKKEIDDGTFELKARQRWIKLKERVERLKAEGKPMSTVTKMQYDGGEERFVYMEIFDARNKVKFRTGYGALAWQIAWAPWIILYVIFGFLAALITQNGRIARNVVDELLGMSFGVIVQMAFFWLAVSINYLS